MKKPKLKVFAFATVAVVFALLFWWHEERVHRKPIYEDGFSARRVNEWVPLGGSWHLHGDEVVVSASEGDAKLMLRAPPWSDYQVWADVKLLGHAGTAGILVRASTPATSNHELEGYAINLRFADAGLEIARLGETSISAEPTHVPGGVHIDVWYRLHVVAVGCRIGAEVRNLLTGETATAAFEDTPASCYRSGSVALRTTAQASAWRAIRVAPADAQTLEAMLGSQTPVRRPSYPIKERDYSAMREAYLAEVPATEINRPTSLGSFGPIDVSEAAPLISIDHLRSHFWSGTPVRLVGVVTSTKPLYVQDGTGGIHVVTEQNASFRTGDEVELVGKPTMLDSSLAFTPAAGRYLSDRVSVTPLSVSAAQAASGRYEGTLIELTTFVRSSKALTDGTVLLALEDSGQRFTAVVPYNLFDLHSSQAEKGSRIRLQGVCSGITPSGADHEGFTIYAASSADLTLLQGAPWWTGQRLVAVIGVMFLCAVGATLLFGHLERSKLRLVQEERQRLAHDMHDTLAQSLAGVGFRLQGIHHSAQISGVVPQEYVDDLKTTCDLVAHTHREASSNIAALHPSGDTNLDVLARLERAVLTMVDDDEFPVIVSSHGTVRLISPFVADTLYRVGREALANALRHAQAHSIRVQLTYRSNDVVLSISDDGVGMKSKPSTTGFGMRSMRERCQTIRASLLVEDLPEGGCRVQVTSPYRLRRGLAGWA